MISILFNTLNNYLRLIKMENSTTQKPSFEEILNNPSSKKTTKQKEQPQTEKTARRTRSSANSANNQIQEKISNARNAVRMNTKAQIVLGGISDALHDIAIGNFDDLEMDALSALDDFTAHLENARDSLILLESTEDPKLLSASH
jgi:hypothetical protein